MGQNTSTPSAATPDDEPSKESVIYVLGKGGHGKSSLVNALACQAVAQVRHVYTLGLTTEEWNVTFGDGKSCKVMESRTAFEQSTLCKTSLTSKLEKELAEHKPRVVLYLVSCSEVRSSANEFELITKFFKSRKGKKNEQPIVFVVLTKADACFDTRMWPIEDHFQKRVLLRELLEYTSTNLLFAANLEPLQNDSFYYGFTLKGCEPFQGILPITTLLTGNAVNWNTDKLHGLLIKALCNEEQPYDFRMEIVQLQNVLDEVKGLFDVLCNKKGVVGAAYEKCRQTALQPLVDFLEDLIEKARSPIVYLMGRSGHGKSSLINALTNTSQAKVGHIKPTTPESVQYDIVFEGQNISWKIVDSRGIFESTKTDGSPSMLATKQVKKDLMEYKPDVILHVINCSEARNLSADLKFVGEIFNDMKSNFGQLPPVIVALTKADVFYHHMLWPIEDHMKKQKALEELLEYMSTPILSSGTCEFLDPAAKYYGCHLKGCEPFLYVVPVATLLLEPPVIWNVNRLNELIGTKLPLEAWLHFYKSQKREKSMKELALKIVYKMAAISYAIGAIPIPGISFVFLMPLYVIMISLIAKLAGREFSTSTTKDFLTTCSFWQGTALAAGTTAAAVFLALAEVIESVLFGVGCLISAPMTASTTYCVGRTAIAYFFDNEIHPPDSFKKDWNPPQS